MKCPKCNADIPNGSLVCTTCGNKTAKCKVCSGCGGLIPEDVLFCPVCKSSTYLKKVDVEAVNCLSAEKAHKEDVNSNIEETNEEAPELINIPENPVEEEAVIVEDKEEKPEEDLPKGDFEEPVITGNSTPEDDVKTEENTDALNASEKLEKTMKIPVVKPRSYRYEDIQNGRMSFENDNRNPVTPSFVQTEPVFYEEYPVRTPSAPAAAPAPRPGASAPRKKAHSAKSSGNSKNILIFFIVFLTVILVGISSIFIYLHISGGRDDEQTNSQNTTENSLNSANKQDEQKPDDEKDTKKPFEPDIDLTFDFAEDVVFETEEDAEVQFVNHENNEHYFICKVPENFENTSASGKETRFSPEDNTAYMDIGAMENSEEWTPEEVKDAVVDSLGGGVEYETDPAGWFVVRLDKNGVSYYQKCYVNQDSVYYMEFVYPIEYADVYDDYLKEIEASFK